MSEKWSTVIFNVDLECKRCNSKIKKTICNLQDRCEIKTVAYDEKKKTVTISGPFDPKKVIKKICCRACEVIKEIEIVEKKVKKPDPPQPEPVPAPPPPEPTPEPEPEPTPKPTQPEPEPTPKPTQPEPEPEPTPKPTQPEPEPEPTPKPTQPYPQHFWGPGTGCCCRPWFEPYYGGCKCCSCGWVYYVPVYIENPKPTYVYGGPCHVGPTTCEFVYEEEPSGCKIM